MKHKKSKNEQKKSPSKAKADKLKVKQRLFMLFTLLIPVFFLVLLELGLQIFEYGGNTALFISTPDKFSQYYGINLNVARRYFSALPEVPSPRKDLFLKEKPANSYRIFVLGGSTTAGFPYGNNLTFTRILNRRLSDTFPDKRIEVVNTAMTAINSYTLMDFMDEILAHQPDALFIYAGHNEFYGALGVASVESLGESRWIVKMYLKLKRFKTFLMLRDVVMKIGKLTGSERAVDIESDPGATMMERIVKNKIIPLESSAYEAGKKQFKQNLSEIFRKARQAGIQVLISELVSNVRDQEPFVSVNHENLPSAKEVYRNAKVSDLEGKYDEARKKYYRAKDLDALRFRASEEFNEIIHELAAEFKIPVVPMKKCFEAVSPNKLIGNNLMHEHLHPTIDGYFLMAEAFYHTMREEKLISNDWQETNIKPSSYYRHHWGFTALDSVFAILRITQLTGGWPFRNSSGPNLALHNYKSTTIIDSIALEILRSGTLTLEQGHIKLASYYEEKGYLESAFREYEALIYTVPFLDLFYQPAVQLLVRMKKYPQALQILHESLKYQETAFAFKWIGQIYLVNNETQKGISYLEKAREMTPQDLSMLYNLSRAYFKISEFKKGDQIFEQLESISPNSGFLTELKDFRASSLEQFMQASEYLKRARSHLKDKEYNQALAVLQQSLQIRETALANELIGTILMMQGRGAEALHYLKIAHTLKSSADPQLLYYISNAYFINAEYQNAWLTLKEVKKIQPYFSDPGNLENKLILAMHN